jgi:hypothetical protein
MSNAKTFTLGAVAGAIFGATVFGLIGHFLVVGVVVAGVGVIVLQVGRRAALRRTHRKELAKPRGGGSGLSR